MAVEAALKPLGQGEKVCATEPPDARDTPWHCPACRHQHHQCLAGGNRVGTRREKPPLWLLVMTSGGKRKNETETEAGG